MPVSICYLLVHGCHPLCAEYVALAYDLMRLQSFQEYPGRRAVWLLRLLIPPEKVHQARQHFLRVRVILDFWNRVALRELFVLRRQLTKLHV